MWDGEAWVRTGKNPEGPGALRRGLATGYEQTKGLVFDVLPALAYSSFGYDEAATKNLLDFKARMDKLEEQGLKSRVGLEDVKDLGSAGQFALEAIGESPASILATIATGGTGGILGKIAGNRAVAAAESVAAKAALQYGQGRALSPLVARRAEEIASKTGLKVLDEEVQRQAIRQVYNDVGMLAGAAVGTGAQNIPESFANLYDETGELRPGEAFAAGALKSALDLITPIQLLRRTRGPDVADKVSDAIAAKLLKGRKGPAGAVAGTLETMVTEGLTEGAQEFIDQMATTILADKSVDWMRILESSLKGGIGGAPFGAAAGYMGQRSREQREQAEVARIEEAEQQKASQQAAIEDLHRLPEDYQKRREFGEYFYDVAYHNQRVRTLEEGMRREKAKKAEANPAELERYQRDIDYHRGKLDAPEGFAVATRERLTAKLADHYGMNDEEQAALLKMPRNEFEAVLREAAQDPTAISKIPELRDVDFLFTDLPRVQQLLLPPPTPFAYDVPGVGVVSAKQADAIIQRWWGRPSLSEDMTPDREDKARQLNQLDPQVNPQAANIDPNERRMLALNIIFGSDNVQLVQAGEGFAGPTPLPGDTVPKLEPIDRATVTGQVGTREGTYTLDNIYNRVVQALQQAPRKALGKDWLLDAAGVNAEQDPARREALAKLVNDNAASIWGQLTIDKRVKRAGYGSYRAVPPGLRLQELGQKEVERVLNLDTLNKELDKAAQTGENLGLVWLTRSIGKQVLPGEAQAIWDALYEKGAVLPKGMYYRAVPRSEWVAKEPRPKPKPEKVPVKQVTAGKMGEMPANMPAPRWNAQGTEIQPNEPVRSDAETESEIGKAWPKLADLQDKARYLRYIVMREMARTGKEHATVLDLDSGDLTYAHTSDSPDSVTMLDKGGIRDQGRNFIYQHSHPNDTALSGADNTYFVTHPTMVAGFAHGAKGTDSIVTMDPVVRAHLLSDFNTRYDVGLKIGLVWGKAFQHFDRYIPRNVTVKNASREDLFRMQVRAANLAVARLGITQYGDTDPTDLKANISNLDGEIENFYKMMMADKSLDLKGMFAKFPKAVNKAREANGKGYFATYDRLSEQMVEPGGVEAILGERTKAPGRPAKTNAPSVLEGDTGAAEAGRGYPAPEGNYPDVNRLETPRDLTSMGRRAEDWTEVPAVSKRMLTEKVKKNDILFKEAQALWDERPSLTQGVKNLLDMLTMETNRTSKEHAFALSFTDTPEGKFFDFFTTNNNREIRINENSKLARVLYTPFERIFFVHSHPSNVSFSRGDIESFGASAGEKLSLVRGSKGFVGIMVKPDSLWGDAHYGNLAQNAAQAAYQVVKKYVFKNPVIERGYQDGTFSAGQLNLAYTRLLSLAVARLGLIHYTDTAPLSDLDFIPNWREAVESITKSPVAEEIRAAMYSPYVPYGAKEALANGYQYLDEYNRLAKSFGEPGGIEKLLQGPANVAGRAAQAQRPGGVSRATPASARNEPSGTQASLREMVQPLPGTMRQGSLVLPSSMGELAPAMNTLTKELERQDKMADALNEAYSCRI
jgi:hypothetical protein